MAEMMKAALLERPGEPFAVRDVPRPVLTGGDDVIIRVAAAGLVPNMRAVVSGKEWYVLPPMPAVYGLDAAGTVESCGSNVVGFRPGDRVYINPVLSCGGCAACRAGRSLLCDSFTLRGYFCTGPDGPSLQKRYPYGAFAEYTLAPASSLVRLPDVVTFEQAARFGYLGTSYHALQKAGVKPGSVVIINGVTGTLGVGGVELALAMGAKRVLGTGRNANILKEVESIDSRRVRTADVTRDDLTSWLLEQSDGIGADSLVDFQGRGSPIGQLNAALKGLRKGGSAVVSGAVSGAPDADYVWLLITGVSLTGSVWFTTAEGQEMADLAGAGVLDLSVWKTRAFSLEDINEGLAFVAARQGGFTNVVVQVAQ